MLSPPALVQRARLLGRRFFFQFGLHCATHQIRVILISGVVITSLFYPALDLYTSHNSLSVYEALTSSASNEGLPNLNDLVAVWAGHPSLRVHEDAVTRAKCRDGHALRTERIVIQSGNDEDDGALNQRTLLSLFDLEAKLASTSLHHHRSSASSSSPCLTGPDGKCIVISPLAFWNYDPALLLADDTVLDTINSAPNISVAGIPVSSSMVLAGRGSYDHHVAGDKIDYADYLVLTYFFPQSTCWSASADHSRWAHAVQKAAMLNPEAIIQVPEATLMALEYNPHQSSSKGWSAVSASVYLAYIAFFAYVAWSARFMHAVHSRIGVTFTALVEIAVSTITSLSVCALVGFKITLVPWELLPIVIVFVGAENMFNLVDAVGKTSVSLSVKQRIAEGLSRAGTSNTLKVVSYNSILGIIAVYGTGAVRQFCIFAIVVLVAHWFLAHTFFIAVLSIDIARLELDELLRHDASLVPSLSTTTQNPKQPRSRWQKLIMTMQKSLRGRAATNISLLMLLGIVGSLYYTTYTTSSLTATTTSPSSRTPKPRTRSPQARIKPQGQDGTTIPTAEHIWKTLNPMQTPQLHLLIESPIFVTSPPPPSSSHADNANANNANNHHGGLGLSHQHQATLRSRSTRTFKFFLWLLSIMVVPIAVTISALYGLLLYLLKNTELLEAQRHRQEGGDISLFSMGADGDTNKASPADVSGADASEDLGAKFWTLKRGMRSDVELIGVSGDGKVVVCVGLRDEVVVWFGNGVGGGESGKKKKESRCVAVEGVDAILKMAASSSSASGSSSSTSPLSFFSSSSPSSSSIVSLAVDKQGKHFALGTRNGTIIVWTIDISSSSSSASPTQKIKIRPLPLLWLKGCSAPVTEMHFVPPLVVHQQHQQQSRPHPHYGGINAARTPPVPEVELPAYLRRSASASGLNLGSGSSGNGSSLTVPNGNGTAHSPNTSGGINLLATYDNGLAAKWTVGAGKTPSLSIFKPFIPSSPSPSSSSSASSSSSITIHRASLLHVSPDDSRVLIAFSLSNGTISLVETGEFEPTLPFHSAASPSPLIEPTTSALMDPVTKLHACRVKINGSMRIVVAAATLAGCVSLWDGVTGECIFVFEDLYGPVTQLKVEPLNAGGKSSSGSETCRNCGLAVLDGVVVAFSVDGVVQFSKLVVEDYQAQAGCVPGGPAGGGLRRCCCGKNPSAGSSTMTSSSLTTATSTTSIPPLRTGAASRSRSDSNSTTASNSTSSSSQLSSPIIPRARLSTAFEASTTAAFPVSGHGVHSRRASEKDSAGRRSSEFLNIIPPFPVSNSSPSASAAGSASLSSSPSTSTLSPSNGNNVEMWGYDRSGSTTPTKASHSVWRNGVVVTLDDVTVERGGWGVVGRKFVGIRRRPRGLGVGGDAGTVGSVDVRSIPFDLLFITFLPPSSTPLIPHLQSPFIGLFKREGNFFGLGYNELSTDKSFIHLFILIFVVYIVLFVFRRGDS